MRPGDDTLNKGTSGEADRRAFVRLMAGASLTLTTALVAGCANMQADPKRPRSKTHITGRGGANGK